MFVLWSTTYQNEFCHHFNTRTLCAPFTKNCSYVQCSQESQSLLGFCFFFLFFFLLLTMFVNHFWEDVTHTAFYFVSAGNTMDCYVWKDCYVWSGQWILKNKLSIMWNDIWHLFLICSLVHTFKFILPYM